MRPVTFGYPATDLLSDNVVNKDQQLSHYLKMVYSPAKHAHMPYYSIGRPQSRVTSTMFVFGRVGSLVASIWAVGSELVFLAAGCPHIGLHKPSTAQDISLLKRALWYTLFFCSGVRGPFLPRSVPLILTLPQQCQSPGHRETHSGTLLCMMMLP